MTAGDPQGWDGLVYFLLSIAICILYTIILGIFGALKKSRPLWQGVLLSLVVSYLAIYMTAEVL